MLELLKKLWAPTLIILAILISVLSSFRIIVFKADVLSEVIPVLSLLAAFALFIERATEVFLSAMRSEQADLKDLKIAETENRRKEIINENEAIQQVIKINDRLDAKQTKDMDDLKDSLEKIIAANSKNEELKITKDTLKGLYEDRKKYRIESGGMARWAGLAFGVIVAAVGVRSLGVFIDPDHLKTLKLSNQLKAINTVDILFTGAVLAGGSEAINKLMKLYTKVTQTATKKAESKGN